MLDGSKRGALRSPRMRPRSSSSRKARSTKTVLTQPDALKRLNLKGPLSDQQRQSYLDLWQETKAYIAQ